MSSSATMKTKQLTHAEQDRRSAAYMRDLLAAPRFAGVESMNLVSAIYRDIHMRHYPEMRDSYRALGMDMHKLHFEDVGELRYVHTNDADGRVWEIKGVLWSHDNSYAPRAEIVADFELWDEERLNEHISEYDAELANEREMGID